MAKYNVVINKTAITPKVGKTYIKLKNTGGPRGVQGQKGDTGDPATVTAGTATTLPAGSTPVVTNSGTATNAVFNFGIPKGDKGDKGDTGSAGAAATITVGSTTTGNPGTNASVTNSGTSSAAVLNFTIPRGAAGQDGADGADGADGESATITVGTTTTLPAGSSATVTNTGTSSAAVLNFGIPKGEKGDSGSGAGDMSMSDYDPNGIVKTAGGIVAYVADEIPTVPTKTSDLTNDGSDGTSTYVEADELATVATTGSYSDLTNKPTIPAAQVNSDWNANSGVEQILNKPTIPTVNNATLTLTQNGTTAGTFTANSATDTTIDLSSSNTTTFYCSNLGNSSWDNHIYSDSGMTTQITRQEFLDACEGGSVIIKSTYTMPPNEDWYYAVLSYIHIKNSGGTTTGVVASVINYLGVTGKITGSGTMTSTTFGYTAYTGGITVYDSTGQSTTGVMSQKAVTDLAGTLETLTGSGAPTTSTTASVGQFYMDTATGNVYVCTDDTSSTYTWDAVAGGTTFSVTNTDPGEGATIAANSLIGVYDLGSVSLDYSTNEHETGIKWINGKMIYAKTNNSLTTMPNATTKMVAHGISNLSSVIAMSGAAHNGTTGETIPLPYVGSSAANSIAVRVDSTGIYLTSSSDMSAYNTGSMTLYYLKSST